VRWDPSESEPLKEAGGEDSDEDSVIEAGDNEGVEEQQPEEMFLPQMPRLDGGDHGKMLCGLATLLHRLGRLDDAKGLYHEALDAQIRVQCLHDHPEKFTSIHHSLAAAKSARTSARNNPIVGTILSRQAHLYREMGLHQQALETAKEACKIKLQMLGELHDEYAVSLSAMGAIYLQQHEIFQVGRSSCHLVS
jgi:tetratricopeptide (TPR) repeat protein